MSTVRIPAFANDTSIFFESIVLDRSLMRQRRALNLSELLSLPVEHPQISQYSVI